jgi:hypothetical protein
MTAVPLSPALATAPRGAGRLRSVLRLQFTNPATLLITPLIVLACIFAVNVAVWAIVEISSPGQPASDFSEGFSYSGASLWIFVYMAVAAIQAMNGTFRLALGYGATRRAYFAGTALALVALSIAWTALLTVLGLVEDATNGWGLGGRMFTAVYFGPTWLDRVVIELCLFLFFSFAGTAFGAVFVRWRRNGLLILGGVLLGMVVLAGLVIALTSAWPAVAAWFGSTPPAALGAWLLVPAALLGAVGFAVLRRATPRD